MSAVQRKVHAIAAFASFLIIGSFWTATVAAELFLSHDAVAKADKAA